MEINCIPLSQLLECYSLAWDVETNERTSKKLIAPKPYQGMKLDGVQGLTKVQVMRLEDLGASAEIIHPNDCNDDREKDFRVFI